jgi:hypothetical protein
MYGMAEIMGAFWCDTAIQRWCDYGAIMVRHSDAQRYSDTAIHSDTQRYTAIQRYSDTAIHSGAQQRYRLRDSMVVRKCESATAAPRLQQCNTAASRPGRRPGDATDAPAEPLEARVSRSEESCNDKQHRHAQ